MGLKTESERLNIAYTRVSGAAQKPDLVNQVKTLEQFCTEQAIQVDKWMQKGYRAMKTREARPISELEITMMSENDAARLRGYLEGGLHCCMTYMSRGYFLIKFPEGTVEEECTEPDPRYQQESIIKLPGGATLRKIINWPCTRSGCPHTRLLLPGEPEERHRRPSNGAW